MTKQELKIMFGELPEQAQEPIFWENVSSKLYSEYEKTKSVKDWNRYQTSCKVHYFALSGSVL